MAVNGQSLPDQWHDGLLDEHGQKLSKSEFKRLQKAERVARERHEKKAQQAAAAREKAGAAPDSGPVLEGDEAEGDDLDPNLYYERRVKAIAPLRGDGGAAYPHKFHTSMRIPEFVQQHEQMEAGTQLTHQTVSLAGRVYGKRRQGKLIFYDLKAEGAKVQIMANSNNSGLSLEDFAALHNGCKRGDIVGVQGWPGKSKMGELSIFASRFVVLSYCLHMLPKRRLENQETRYRQRYLDGIVNPFVHDIFATRSRIIEYVRRFLIDRHFIEVETPMMNMIPGGAVARPFVTHHNDLDMQLYLRIAPELFLKMCVVGGLDRVFEIGRQFRNEGIDMTHNPEFTSCEFYQAYADYNDLMDTTEEMVSGLVLAVKGSYKVQYHSAGPTEPPVEIDFTPPWPRIPMVSGLGEALGVDMPADLETEAARQFLLQQCSSRGVECTPPQTTARLLDKLVGEFLESRCMNPSFITDHPKLMSPLAKWHRSKPGMTERFELFVNCREVANAYTELNDPVTQAERFAQQAKDKAQGDDEAMFVDEGFITALEYGLPPTAGWGMGIDRLTMLLTDTNNIKEVLLFPAMKPDDQQIKAQAASSPGGTDTTATDVANQLAACEASISKLQSDKQRLQQLLSSLQGSSGDHPRANGVAPSSQTDEAGAEQSHAERTKQLLALWRERAAEAALLATNPAAVRTSADGSLGARLISFTRNLSGMEYGR